MNQKETNYQIECREFEIQELERKIERLKRELKLLFNHTY